MAAMGHSTYYNTDSKEILRSSQSNLPTLKERQGRTWDRSINRYLDEPIPEENRGYAFFEADWIPIVGATLQFDEAGAITGQIVPRLPQSEIERHLFARTDADENARIGSARRAGILARLAHGGSEEHRAARENSNAKHSAFHARIMLALIAAIDNVGVNHNLTADSDLFPLALLVADRILAIAERTHAGHKARAICESDIAPLIDAIKAATGSAEYVIGVIRREQSRTNYRELEIFIDQTGAAEAAAKAWALDAAVGINVIAKSGGATITVAEDSNSFGIPADIFAIDASGDIHSEAHLCAPSFERGVSIASPVGAGGAVWIRIENHTAQIAVILDADDNSEIARIAAATIAPGTADITPAQGANGLAVRLEAVEAPAEQPEQPADETPPSE